jgi:hypothetical protein
MVPQMNDTIADTYDNLRKMRREQLINECLKQGMLVAGYEDEETLEMYIEMAHDDEFDIAGLSTDDIKTNVTLDAKINCFR